MSSQLLLMAIMAGVLIVIQAQTPIYSLYDINVNVTDAITICNRQNGNLVDMSSEDEIMNVSNLMADKGCQSAWAGIYVMPDKTGINVNYKEHKKTLGWAKNQPEANLVSVMCTVLVGQELETRNCDEEIHGVLCEN